MNVKHVPFASLALSAIAMPLTADVIVVNAAGGGDFTSIQPAVDAAVNGDTILVKDGNYAAFTIDNKELSVVADVGLPPEVAGRVLIRNIAAGSTVVLAGLQCNGTTTGSQPALAIQNSTGSIRLVACAFSGADAPAASATGRNAVQLANATDVAFAECMMLGGTGYTDTFCQSPATAVGGEGLTSQSSNIALYACGTRGGRGGTGDTFVGARPGGNGADVHLSDFLFASRSNFQGGNGGPAGPCLLDDPAGGDGGDGLVMSNDSLSVQLLDNELNGGTATSGFQGGGFVTGTPGQPVAGGPPFQYVVSGFELAMPTIARESEYITLTFTGDPGDQVFLNDGTETTFALVPSWRGVVIAPFPDRASGPVRERRWGVIPASGVLKQVYRAPVLPAGVEAQTHFLQAYRVRASGITLGSFATLTVLDSSF